MEDSVGRVIIVGITIAFRCTKLESWNLYAGMKAIGSCACCYC